MIAPNRTIATSTLIAYPKGCMAIRSSTAPIPNTAPSIMATTTRFGFCCINLPAVAYWSAYSLAFTESNSVDEIRRLHSLTLNSRPPGRTGN